MKIAQMSLGFIEVPGQISLNIFVQGCKLNCQNCHSQKLRSFDGGIEFTTDDILQIILESKLSNWICWLGGDATNYPEELLEISKNVKLFNRFVCLYTGRELDDISKEKYLHYIDLLKTGPFIGKTVSDPETNQKFFLKNKQNEFVFVKFNNLIYELNNFVKHGGFHVDSTII